MIVYNVTIKLEAGIEKQWLKWMKEEHIPELLNTGLFEDAKLCRLLELEEEGETFVAQYFCKNMEAYKTYLELHATSMREKGFERFGNKFIAFRTLMEVV